METWYFLFIVILVVNVIALIMSESKNAFVWFCLRMALIALGYVIYIFYLEDLV